MRTDNQHLNHKATQVNKYLFEFCRDMNLYFLDISKRIKPQHLNKSKLQLKKSGSRILSDIYYEEIPKIFIGPLPDNYSGFLEFNFDYSKRGFYRGF